MTPESRDPLHREIAALRDQVETLEAERTRWAEIWAPLANQFPAAWKLFPTQRRMLGALMRRSPHAVSNEAMHCASAGNLEPESHEKIVAFHMVAIRRALNRHVPGAVIETIHCGGYRLPTASRALIEAAMEAGR